MRHGGRGQGPRGKSKLEVMWHSKTDVAEEENSPWILVWTVAPKGQELFYNHFTK